MTRLEDLQPTAAVRGILPDQVVAVVSIQWFGSEALELTYKASSGRVANELLYRHDEARLEIVEYGRPWSFDGEGHLFRLVSEAHRIRLAHLFDPVLAVHTSLVEPLPHQITAVYEAMLPRQPLRFLLADDPGAGKTIMAGLFVKELVARGDLQRCLVVCPGSLTEQWQDELYRRFQLPFEILTNDRTGFPMLRRNFTQKSQATCVRSLTAPRPSPTINALEQSVSRLLSYNGALHFRQKLFTSRSIGAANVCKSALGSSNSCNAALSLTQSPPQRRRLIVMTWRTSRRPRITRSKKSRSKSLIKQQRRVASVN